MRARNRFATAGLLCACALASGLAGAQDNAQSAQDCFIPAFKAGDADAVAACYAEDAIMWFPGGPMAKGRAAIRDGFAGYFAQYAIRDVTLDVLGHEDLGPTMAAWGTYTIHTVDKDTGAEAAETGRFTDVSKRVGDRWLYVVDHPSNDPPAGSEQEAH